MGSEMCIRDRPYGKGDSHGIVDRTKARTVAMGHSQVEGVDYFETFALRPPLLVTGR